MTTLLKSPDMTTSQPNLDERNSGVLPSQLNWIEKLQYGVERTNLLMYEYRLYSDAHITGRISSITWALRILEHRPESVRHRNNKCTDCSESRNACHQGHPRHVED